MRAKFLHADMSVYLYRDEVCPACADTAADLELQPEQAFFALVLSMQLE